MLLIHQEQIAASDTALCSQTAEEVKESFDLFDRAGSGKIALFDRIHAAACPSFRVAIRFGADLLEGASFCVDPLGAVDGPERNSLTPHPWRAGKVSHEDFGTVVRACGHNPTEAELGEDKGDQVRPRAPAPPCEVQVPTFS